MTIQIWCPNHGVMNSDFGKCPVCGAIDKRVEEIDDMELKYDIKDIIAFKTTDDKIFESRFEAEHYVISKKLEELAGKIMGNVAGSYAYPDEVLEFLKDNKNLILKYLENVK